MENRHPKRVEDYTQANLVLILFNLLWLFFVLYATWGIGIVLILGAILNHLITRLDMYIRRQRAGVRLRETL